MKLKPLIFFFVLIIHSIKAQYYNLPNDYFFSLFTEKKLAEINNNIHTNLKPYIPFFSEKYLYVTDSHSLYKNSSLSKFIFLNHAIKIESPTEKFKLQLDSRTTITLKTEEQLSKWMELYPKAELIV